MLLLVKCYDNKMVKSLGDSTIFLLVGAKGGEPTKKEKKKTASRYKVSTKL